ncbi:hypothetical protein PIROE2DRAFT_5330, partial [Piromyces sp. E2]
MNSKKNNNSVDEQFMESSLLPNLTNYVHSYYDDENLGEHSLSINTPGNIICFQSLSYYYSTPTNDYDNLYTNPNNKSALEILFSELKKNPNMSISQLTEIVSSKVKNFQEEKEIISRKRHTTYTHHSNSNLHENTTESIIQNDNINVNNDNLNTEITTTSTVPNHSSSNTLIILPKMFSVYINKDYMKDETFVPYEKYKYKILQELVSTAHAQLYLVTEKHVSESGGFSQSSLNLNINSNSVINYCDNDQELVKSSSSSSSPPSKNILKSCSTASIFSLAPKKHVLKVIYLAKDKESLTVESEKKYKKMIKEALFLRELNHRNIQKFITSW